MNFISVMGDLGGLRLGFEGAGWTCIASLSWERLLGSASVENREENASEGPARDRECHALAVELPSSERVSGSWDGDGSWRGVTAMVTLLQRSIPQWSPQFVVILGRRTLLSERLGASFAALLLELNSAGYAAAWVSINLSWLGIPQDSRRVVVFGMRETSIGSPILARELLRHITARLLEGSVQATALGDWISIAQLLETRTPRIGLKAPSNASPFGNWGLAIRGAFSSGAFRFDGNPAVQPNLRTVFVGDGILGGATPVSLRFVSRNGESGLQIKAGNVAHSVGPGVSAWPLFGLPIQGKGRVGDRLDMTNWHRVAYGYDVFRLTPLRALMLFGQEAEPLGKHLLERRGPMTEAYRIVSATTPPRLATRIAEFVSR